jgi:hypothetical protein
MVRDAVRAHACGASRCSCFLLSLLSTLYCLLSGFPAFVLSHLLKGLSPVISVIAGSILTPGHSGFSGPFARL